MSDNYYTHIIRSLLYTHNNWQSFRQLQAFTMYTNIGQKMQLVSIPLLSVSPFFIPLLPFVSLYLLGILLAVIGSCPPRSQVARKLISPFPHSTPYTPHSEIPTPRGFPRLNIQLTKTTSRTWVTRSSTIYAPSRTD
jgi:hypothetical protein